MTPDRPSGAPRWMRVLLILSLAANLLIVGLVAGALVFGRGGGDRPDRIRAARDLAPMPLVLAMDREDRQMLASRLRERSAPFRRRDRAEVQAAVSELLDVLRDNDFEPDALRALMEDERARALGRQEAGQAIMLDYLSNLGAEERRAYADRLEKVTERFGRKSN